MDLVERARLLLRKAEPSVSGSHGHAALLSAAGALVNGFGLDEGLAFELLMSEFNPRCMPPWAEKDVRRKVKEATRLGSSKPQGYLIGRERASDRPHASSSGAPEATQPERQKKYQQFDETRLRQMMVKGFTPSSQWLAERSPIDPREVTPQQFLDAIFEPGEAAFVFLNFFSQGELGHLAGDPGKSYFLGSRPGLKPVLAQNFPKTGREGAWFLPVPLDGKWYPTDRVDEYGNPVMSRRSAASVKKFRHLVLESDSAADEQWLNLLCQLPLPITALYTSGGKSIHALVKIDCESKSQFDAFRDRISGVLSKLGADPAAITGVRLTRLPGVFREGTRDKEGRYHRYPEPRLQRLLFLNPNPEVSALKMLPRLRVIESV
jgi:hypothetical protein